MADWKKELEDSLKKKMAERDAIQKLTRAQSIGLNILSQIKSVTAKANTASGKDLEGAIQTLDREVTKLKEDIKVLKSVRISSR